MLARVGRFVCNCGSSSLVLISVFKINNSIVCKNDYDIYDEKIFNKQKKIS